jgi:hypothetical protein
MPGVLGVICFGLVAAASGNETGDGSGGERQLPYAQGRSFATLEEYLEFLKELGAMDIPYYEEQPDGRFVLVQRLRPGEQPKIFTREELAETFGFTE